MDEMNETQIVETTTDAPLDRTAGRSRKPMQPESKCWHEKVRSDIPGTLVCCACGATKNSSRQPWKPIPLIDSLCGFAHNTGRDGVGASMRP